MPVTLYGINKYGQVFKSFVTPEEVDFYVKEKGLSLEPIKAPKVEKPVKKEVEKQVMEVIEKPIKKSKSKGDFGKNDE